MLALVILLYIVLTTGLNQFYKLTTHTMKKPAAQTIGLQLVAGLSCLLFVPFFEFRLPSNPWTYLFLSLSCVFYAINKSALCVGIGIRYIVNSFYKYISYLIYCGKSNPTFFYYESFRAKLISEENIIQSYFDLFQLFKIHHIQKKVIFDKSNK